jgi:hypothetical protein
MQRTSLAQLLALALAAVPTGFTDAMQHAQRAPRTWQPSNNRHRSHAGEAAKRKARNRKRNKIARASRRANRA